MEGEKALELAYDIVGKHVAGSFLPDESLRSGEEGEENGGEERGISFVCLPLCG